MNRRLCFEAVAVATILAPTQKLPRLPPRREWRAKRATPCQAEAVAIFAWGRELLPRRPPGYTGVGSTSEQHNIIVGTNEWPACENLEKKLCARGVTFSGFYANVSSFEGWNALAHSFSRGLRTLAFNSFRRQYCHRRVLCVRREMS